jgi:catechol 2,3-dioxygenase-like lactoylglutathione lyase family enzyme
VSVRGFRACSHTRATLSGHERRATVHIRPEFRAALPTADIQRARRFYEDQLGLQPKQVDEQGVTYEGAGETTFLLFPSSGKASGSHTQISFGVEDVDAELRGLRAHGIEAEDVGMPGMDPDSHIVTMGDARVAWLRDPDGNLLALSDTRTVS